MARNDKVVTVYGDIDYENVRYFNEDNPWDNWVDLPVFDPCSIPALAAFCTLELTFENEDDVKHLSNILGGTVTDRTRSQWYPHHVNNNRITGFIGEHQEGLPYKPENMPKYPIYIISKSRWEVRLTSDSLIEMGIPHYMVVEEHQLEQYKAHTDPKWVTCIVLPQKYLDEYETCDEFGSTKSKGPGAARNFAWDHSISIGAKRHWVMDDNQRRFYRVDGSDRRYVMSGAIFRAMEDHSDRYDNVYISGPHYKMFVVPEYNKPPFIMNSRIYSTLLILNDIPYRWRGRYNEDTDLSLRVLKDGHCTVQYNAFSTGKVATQAVKGGNTEAFYSLEGTLPKSKMLEELHPDVAKVKWMNSRWHHYVDYNPFKSNRLKPATDGGYEYRNPDPEYGMKLGKLPFGITETEEETEE